MAAYNIVVGEKRFHSDRTSVVDWVFKIKYLVISISPVSQFPLVTSTCGLTQAVGFVSCYFWAEAQTSQTPY